ncbi:MAG: carboxyl transferase domain-containing protein [Pseudomonadales bacterium]
MFKRVLISNRGEIAIRIAHAAASLGIESVAVYPAVDAQSLHTRVATRAREIPSGNTPDAGIRAYLDGAAIIAAALAEGCDAVHPGYGFLAENAQFVRDCAAAGLVFIGPDADVVHLFGDKLAARALAQSAGVKTVPGSDHALKDAAAAATIAAEMGYPVMLKAAAGGGGRGIRRVDTAAAMAEAFARCQSEAEAAFGDGALFVERLIEDPRHIEVQILADQAGNVIHLHERDCSVQLRHQKVVEVAPAPGLEASLRARLHEDAVRLARAAGLRNAATVEFLVEPASGAHWFIECNPRIQVEHTITEAVTGVDLVEAQFRIAAGETLSALGLDPASGPPEPRGFAVQLRVVALGAGTFTAYREPSGVGVRVDAAGYLGYSPPPQFDPLFAKLICRSGSSGDFVSAVDRAQRALQAFHLAGVADNRAQLASILAHPRFRAGDARTPWLATLETPAGSLTSSVGTFLTQQSAHLGMRAPESAAPARPALPLSGAEQGAQSPLSGAFVSWSVEPGSRVSAGATLAIVSAMKMETAVVAPCAGQVVSRLALNSGDPVAAGEILLAVIPGEPGQGDAVAQTDGWLPLLDEVATLQSLALARFPPDSKDPGVVRQRSRGKLTCRERIDVLLDPGSFREIGSLAGFASHDDEGAVLAFTPANHVGGHGRIDAREVVVCADDFTSRGGHADGAIGAKSTYLDRLSLDLRMPSLRLLDGSSGGGSVAAMVPQQQKSGESTAQESSGAIRAGRPRVTGGGGSFLPGHLGSALYAEQLATVPVVNLLLGSVVGIGAAKAVLGHFSVMVRDVAQLFVAGPPVVSHAMGYEVSKEALGGWHIHCANGAVDNLAESELEAFAMARRFLSYLPASVYEAPPVLAPDPFDPADRRDEALLHIVPRKRTTTFDMRAAIRLLADRDSFFEIGPLWGTDQITGFIRMNGHPLGVIASDSRHINGGALTADGCDKLKRHLDLCDLFHIPVLNLVDNPGFAVGIEHERAATIRKGGEWMIAFAQVRIPLFTVIMRRSFGVAGNNYATPLARSAMRVVWPAADVGGIPPEGGIEAAYKRQLAEAEDPAALRAEINARIESARGPIGPLNRFQMEEMIDPRDTRRLVCEWVSVAYRLVRQPANLVSRPQGFRP